MANESQLAHIEDLDFERDLRPEFRETLGKLMLKLKSPQRLKQVGGRALSSGMLLGLAMEYVEAINNQEVPVVMSCFERVVQVESRRFAEKLFEELAQRMGAEVNEMPYEDGELAERLDAYCAEADERICKQLGEVASTESLIDLRQDFEKRLRGYFKEDVRLVNRQMSEAQCLQELEDLAKQAGHIETSADIESQSFVRSMKA